MLFIPFILAYAYRQRGTGRVTMGTQAGRLLFWVLPTVETYQEIKKLLKEAL